MGLLDHRHLESEGNGGEVELDRGESQRQRRRVGFCRTADTLSGRWALLLCQISRERLAPSRCFWVVEPTGDPLGGRCWLDFLGSSRSSVSGRVHGGALPVPTVHACPPSSVLPALPAFKVPRTGKTLVIRCSKLP